MKKNKKTLIALAVLVLAVLLLAGVYWIARPKTEAGEKQITVSVVNRDGSMQSFPLTTDAEYLSEALLESKLVQCSGSGSSAYVTSVLGVAVDESRQEWWGLTVDGELLMTGVSETPVKDGTVYTLTLNTGW